MGPRVEIGIDAQAHGRASFHPPRHRRDTIELGRRLGVDHQDTGLERRFDLLVGLAHPGENDLARIGAHAKASHQLAARDHIEAGTHRGEQFQHAQVGERLHREADQMIGAGERLVEDPEMAPHGSRAVDVKGSADLKREIGERYVLGVKAIVAVGEVMHRLGALAPGPPCSSFRG